MSRNLSIVHIHVFIWLLILSFVSLAKSEQMVISELNELPLDENNRLQSHWLLYSNTETCKSAMKSYWQDDETSLRNVAALEGNANSIMFSNSVLNKSSCTFICLERGTLDDHISYALPIKTYFHESNMNVKGLHKFFLKSCQAVELGFILYEVPVAEIYWVDSSGELKYLMDINSGEQSTVW